MQKQKDGNLHLTCSFKQLPAKWMFVRALQGTEDLTKNTFKHWVYWLGSVFIVVVCGYILASAVPVFSGLLGVIGSEFKFPLCCSEPSKLTFFGAIWFVLCLPLHHAHGECAVERPRVSSY